MAEEKPTSFSAAARARIARSVHYTEAAADPNSQRPVDIGDRWGKVTADWSDTTPNQVLANLCRQDGSEVDTSREWTVYLSTPLDSEPAFCPLVKDDVIAFRLIYDVATKTMRGLWLGGGGGPFRFAKVTALKDRNNADWVSLAANASFIWYVEAVPCDANGGSIGTDVLVLKCVPDAGATTIGFAGLAVDSIVGYLPAYGEELWASKPVHGYVVAHAGVSAAVNILAIEGGTDARAKEPVAAYGQGWLMWKTDATGVGPIHLGHADPRPEDPVNAPCGAWFAVDGCGHIFGWWAAGEAWTWYSPWGHAEPQSIGPNTP